MKRTALLFLLLLSALPLAFGQGVAVPPQVALKTVNGVTFPLANATITVCPANSLGLPCTPATISLFKDLALSQPLSNPFTADASGNYAFVVAAGNYTVTVTGLGYAGNSYLLTASGLLGVAIIPNPGTNQTVTQPPGTSFTVNGLSFLKNLNSIRFCDQYGGFTDAAIQACINDLPAGGGTAYLASGTWWVGSNLPITVGNKQGVRVVGAGDSTVLTVCGSLGDNPNCPGVPSATTDLFSIAPTGSFQQGNLVFSDFKVLTLSGDPGRYGLNFDGTNGLTYQTTIERLHFFNPFGTANIFANGSGMTNGNLRTSFINNNTFSEPIICHSCGDTVHISNNTISGTGNAIDVDLISGAADALISGNNIVVSGGGIHLGANALNAQVIGNEIETPVGATGSNGALIDLDGAVGTVAAHDTVSGNSCQIINSSTLNCVRVNYCNTCMIYDNRFGRGGSPSTDIVVTANATATQIGTNKWLAGFPFSKMLSDAGTGTTLLGMFNGAIITNSGMQITTPVSGGGSLNPGLFMYNTGHFTFGQNADCGVVLCVAGDIANTHGILLPSGALGYHGLGNVKVQMGDGTGGSGDFAKFDASGDVVDGPTAASIPTVGTPTAGQAACIKSAGPPIVIGFCSTAPGAGGACTCN